MFSFVLVLCYQQARKECVYDERVREVAGKHMIADLISEKVTLHLNQNVH